ncbi:MAG: S-layer family protein [Scytonematopsis contorta HA4267-MV1]|jgi:filamentous hemagglutinin family protein|nr:S-layer family protein [Scytonematopsis contorta HA4267-MV1]
MINYRSQLQLVIVLSCVLTANVSQGQIVPDTTLPTNSTVTRTGNIFSINGGTTAGNNLFHSFERFDVPTQTEAFFNNASSIENIFTRVTGGTVSNIDGVLRGNANANLFLINPNGIIFGANASLNIGGSFVGTTADAIGFGSGNIFSASSTNQQQPLLTINPSALVFNQINKQPIINRSSNSGTGLRVPANRSLLLVGSGISLEGGKLTAPGGRVELASIAGSGTVELLGNNTNLQLNVPTSISRADISLSNAALVNVIAPPGGSIAVNTQNFNLTGGSILQSGVLGTGSTDSQAGNIEINTLGKINLNASGFLNTSRVGAVGNAGNININTNSLYVTNGSFLSAATFGRGNAGSINLNAGNTISFDGIDNSNNPSIASTAVVARAVGNAGNINIITDSLSVTNGALLSTATLGQGNGGNINIKANTVSFDGFASNGSPSFAFSGANQLGAGNAGDININTNSLSLTNGVYLSASTLKKGNAGNININANTVTLDGVGKNGDSTFVSSIVGARGEGNPGSVNITTGALSVTNGAFASASTLGKGNGGNVNIRANTVSIDGVGSNGSSSIITSAVNQGAVGDGGKVNITADSLLVTNGARLTTITATGGKGGDININANKLSVLSGGQILSSSFGDGKSGDITINVTDNITVAGRVPDNKKPNSRIVFNVGPASALSASTVGKNTTGQGGELRVTTNTLLVQDGAQVSVSGQGSRGSGNLSVNANLINLNNSSSLSAETSAGDYGNINIHTRDIHLFNGSKITTNATGNATGGNIKINTDTLVALENSDITANAQKSFGGNININAQVIFGTQYREQLTPESDITATGGEPSLNGVVNINQISTSPTPVETELPETLSDGSNQIATRCSSVSEGNNFVVSNTGGLPADPTTALRGASVWSDLRPISTVRVNNSQQATQSSISNNTSSIVEATGWTLNKKGHVELVASIGNQSAKMQNTALCASK